MVGICDPEVWKVNCHECSNKSRGERRGLRFAVPTSRKELRRWGRMLHNCAGDFGNAVAGGHSWVIGGERDDHHIGRVEVNPADRCVRQHLGPRNRLLSPVVATTMLEALRWCDATSNGGDGRGGVVQMNRPST